MNEGVELGWSGIDKDDRATILVCMGENSKYVTLLFFDD